MPPTCDRSALAGEGRGEERGLGPEQHGMGGSRVSRRKIALGEETQAGVGLAPFIAWLPWNACGITSPAYEHHL
eukprot:4451974-Pleurochrysis_carterae.AAC.2